MLLTTANANAQPQCGYEVQLIQAPACPPFGPRPTNGFGISEQGNIVGRYLDCADAYDQSFMWTEGTGFVILEKQLPVIFSQAHAIENGLIVGWAEFIDIGRRGFLHDGHKVVNLGTLEGGNWSEAHAINSKGQIAGFWGNSLTGPWQAFIWQDGVMNDLGPSIGGEDNRAFGINENGAITGWWKPKQGGERLAFIWEDGQMTDLGPIPGGFSSLGFGININNQVTGGGFLQEPDGSGILTHAFSWEKGEMINIGVLPGFPRSSGLDISDDGTIIGQAWGAGQSGFIWQDGVMSDLDDFIGDHRDVHIEIAYEINNSGQITGTASGPFGIAAVLLTPIDSPLGDLDADCQITTADLQLLLDTWGLCNGCSADLDGNGIVNTNDLLILFSNWG